MKNLKAYLYFYWDMLILVCALLQWAILTLGTITFSLFAYIVLEIIKQTKWHYEIECFEDNVCEWYMNMSVRMFDWADNFKNCIR